MKKLLFVGLFLLAPILVLGNGGDQRIVDGKYFINLSRAPFTPRAGEKTALLISIADVETGKPLRENLVANVRVYKHGDAAAKLPPLFEKKGISVKGGVFELPYTFATYGLHEIFFDFAFTDNPQKIYEVPDFLLDVQESKTQAKKSNTTFLFASTGTIFGLFVGWLVGRKQRQKTRGFL